MFFPVPLVAVNEQKLGRRCIFSVECDGPQMYLWAAFWSSSCTDGSPSQEAQRAFAWHTHSLPNEGKKQFSGFSLIELHMFQVVPGAGRSAEPSPASVPGS